MRKVLLTTAVLIMLGAAWVYFGGDRHRNPIPQAARFSENRSAQVAATVPLPTSVPTPVAIVSSASSPIPAFYKRWEGGRSTRLDDPRWAVCAERDRMDPAWRGKMAIEFYGKVVDQDGKPVPNAQITFSKIDLSADGTTRLKAESDLNGVFAIAGVFGRSLSVVVEALGYYSSKDQPHDFEYAEFSNEDFYEPSRAKPVLFKLIKKQSPATLVYNERQVFVTPKIPIQYAVIVGQNLEIQLLENPPPGQGKWAMSMKASNGGLQTTTEEFPFRAPIGGYSESLVIDSDTAKPKDWSNMYSGGSFYVKVGRNYGRVEVEMISGKDKMRIRSWMNPSGSPDLTIEVGK